jgi:hypothetical protein
MNPLSLSITASRKVWCGLVLAAASGIELGIAYLLIVGSYGVS